MDPMTGMMIAQLGAQAVGGLIGHFTGKGKRKEAERAQAEAQRIIDEVGAGPDLAKEILYKQFEQSGLYTPELEELVTLEAPKVAQIKEDPALRKAQMAGLEMIKQRASGGLSMEDRAALAQIQTAQARDAQAKQQQIIQGMQQRGLSGGGAELAAQLQAASAGAAQAGEEGTRLAGIAAQNALQAARDYGTLGGQIRTQEFDIAKTKARAEDEAALTRFNEAMSRQQRNVGYKNTAQSQNLQERQRINDANINQANQELLRQRNAQATMYQNQLGYATSRANARLGQAQAAQQEAAAKGQQWAGIGSAVGKGITGAMDYDQKQQLIDVEKMKANKILSSTDTEKKIKLPADKSYDYTTG
jgi:hypothetical protein